jgi:hypothetical protein
MLRNEEPRRQRGLHRSSARRPHSQERQRRQGQHLLLRHVSFAADVTPKPPPCNSSNSRRPFFSVSTLHEHIPPTFLVVYWEIQFFLNFSGADELQGHIDYGLYSAPAAGVWSAAFLLLFHSSLLNPILLDGYTFCCGSDGRWLVLGPIPEGLGRLWFSG